MPAGVHWRVVIAWAQTYGGEGPAI